MSHSSKLHMAVWGTRRGVVGRPGESGFWRGVVASPMPVQEQFEGSGVGASYLSSSVRQLEGWAEGGLEDAQQRVWRRLVVLGSHSAGDGAAVLGMVVQRRGWPHRAKVSGKDAPH
jgi:hypothetical protein